MREPQIFDNDPNLEFNIYGTNNLKYKGQLFTGTVLYDDTSPFSFVEYRNGEYDGESATFNSSGLLIEKSYFKNGKYVSGQKWYNNGKLKYDSLRNTLWDCDGTIAYQDGCWFYKNGIIKIKNEQAKSSVFNSNGDIAILTEYQSPINRTKYYHKNLRTNYQEILINLYPEIDTNFSNLKYIVFSWIIQVHSNYEKAGKKILKSLLEHPNAEIRDFAIDLYTRPDKQTWGTNYENTKVICSNWEKLLLTLGFVQVGWTRSVQHLQF